MISDYTVHQLDRAKYKLLTDGTYFGEIPALRGVWASARSLERCRAELREVLEDWLLNSGGSCATRRARYTACV